jgi:hypothetical protein
VKISRRGVESLKAGHVWVYRSDVVSTDGVPLGALLAVADERGKFFITKTKAPAGAGARSYRTLFAKH